MAAEGREEAPGVLGHIDHRVVIRGNQEGAGRGSLMRDKTCSFLFSRAAFEAALPLAYPPKCKLWQGLRPWRGLELLVSPDQLSP